MINDFSLDIPTVVAVIMIIAALMSTRAGRRDARGTWRSAYGVLVLAVLHMAFLYQFFWGDPGAFWQ